MGYVYSDPKRQHEVHALPNVEVYYLEHWNADAEDGQGWYWRPGFPGCLPDGDPIGPFETEAEAIADAQRDDDE